MYAYAFWNVDASQILSRRELALVLAALKKRADRLPNVQMNDEATVGSLFEVAG